MSYVSDRVGTFKAPSERQILPAYAQANLRAGMMYDSWTANLFFTNLLERSTSSRLGESFRAPPGLMSNTCRNHDGADNQL